MRIGHALNRRTVILIDFQLIRPSTYDMKENMDCSSIAVRCLCFDRNALCNRRCSLTLGTQLKTTIFIYGPHFDFSEHGR